MDKRSLELLLAQGLSVARIATRFGKDPSTVSYWMTKHGLKAVNREKHAAKGGIEPERLASLLDAGMTIGQIAAETGLSTGTVRHWLRRHGLRARSTPGPHHAAQVRSSKAAGLVTVTMSCAHHGETEFFLEGRGYYRCKRCRSEAVVRRRRKVKAILVHEAGGRCVLCGYERYLGALEFHHVDPLEKRLGLSYKGAALALATMRNEARKCTLLCANCHAEVEGGVAALPLELLRDRPSCGSSPNTP